MRIYELTHKEITGAAHGWWDDEMKAWSTKNFMFPVKGKLDSRLSNDSYQGANAYVGDDRPATGKIGQSMEDVIAASDPIPKNILSYRGMRLPKSTVDKIIDKLSTTQHIFKSGRPTSWTTSKGTAWDFVKTKGGYRQKPWGKEKESVPVVFEMLTPAGTKVGIAPFTFDIAHEHWLSKTTVMKIYRVRKYQEGVIFQGKIVSK